MRVPSPVPLLLRAGRILVGIAALIMLAVVAVAFLAITAYAYIRGFVCCVIEGGREYLEELDR